MERPGVEFARAPDGAYLAYQVFGEAPVDILWQDDVFSIVDEWWEEPYGRALFEGMAAFSRMICTIGAPPAFQPRRGTREPRDAGFRHARGDGGRGC